MKNKILFILAFLLFFPFTINAYYSSEQFRTDIMDSIRSNNMRQQTQDILDDQTRYNNQALNSYYRQLDSLQAENDFKLKQLQAEIDTRERAEAWQKEKAVLDKELELIIKENELKKREDAISKPASSGIDWDQAMKEAKKAGDAVEKSNKLESSTTSSKKKPLTDIKTPTITPSSGGMFDDVFKTQPKQTSITPTITEPITTPIVTTTPKKNLFKNLFDKFINIFK